MACDATMLRAVPMAPSIKAHQIFYDEASRAAVDPDFEPLDNRNAARPDWYEYWPIREYLLNNDLEADTYYGFVSPTFRSKTRLTGQQVKDFVAAAGGADVVTFSPFPCHAAFFASVFE